MKRKRDYKRKNWGSLARVLFAALAVMALLAGPGFAQNALADIKSDLMAQANDCAGLEGGAYNIVKEKLTNNSTEKEYNAVLADLIEAASTICVEKGWNCTEAVLFVKAGAKKAGLELTVITSTTTSTSSTTSSTTTSSTTTTTSEETTTVSPTTTTTTSEETTTVSPTTTSSTTTTTTTSSETTVSPSS